MFNLINRILITFDVIYIITIVFSIIAIFLSYKEDVDAFVEDPKNVWINILIGHGGFLFLGSLAYWLVIVLYKLCF
jgi:hypothetical protein